MRGGGGGGKGNGGEARERAGVPLTRVGGAPVASAPQQQQQQQQQQQRTPRRRGAMSGDVRPLGRGGAGMLRRRGAAGQGGLMIHRACTRCSLQILAHRLATNGRNESAHALTVKILVVILTTIPWLIFITTLSSPALDDTVVTHVISIGNWNLGDESVVTNDEPVVN